jgi:hypothetical protein
MKQKTQQINDCNMCGLSIGAIGYIDRIKNKESFVICSRSKHLVGQYHPFSIEGKITQKLVIRIELDSNGICQRCLAEKNFSLGE